MKVSWDDYSQYMEKIKMFQTMISRGLTSKKTLWCCNSHVPTVAVVCLTRETFGVQKNYDRLEEGRLWTLLPSKFPPPQKMVGLWQPEFPALEFAGEIFVKPFSFKLVFQGISWDGLTVNHRKMVAHFWKKKCGIGIWFVIAKLLNITPPSLWFEIPTTK